MHNGTNDKFQCKPHVSHPVGHLRQKYLKARSIARYTACFYTRDISAFASRSVKRVRRSASDSEPGAPRRPRANFFPSSTAGWSKGLMPDIHPVNTVVASKSIINLPAAYSPQSGAATCTRGTPRCTRDMRVAKVSASRISPRLLPGQPAPGSGLRLQHRTAGSRRAEEQASLVQGPSQKHLKQRMLIRHAYGGTAWFPGRPCLNFRPTIERTRDQNAAQAGA